MAKSSKLNGLSRFRAAVAAPGERDDIQREMEELSRGKSLGAPAGGKQTFSRLPVTPLQASPARQGGCFIW